MNNSIIEVKKLSKLYKLYDKPIDRMKESLSLTRKKYHKEHYALRDISFTVNKGETVGIIGTNGAGKSTLLKILTGVLNSTEGIVNVSGRISALLELGAGFNPEYTGIENIYLNGTMMGYSKEEIEEKIPSVLEFADIGEFVYQPVKTYSSGMFVRLAFAVAINIEPEILIIDEALSVGDVFFQSKCYAKFEEFKKNGKTIIFVTHDIGSVIKYCDRAILINKGVKTADGKTKEVVEVYKKILLKQEDNIELEEELSREELVETKWKDQININPKIIEYGDLSAKIIDYGIFDSFNKQANILNKDEEFMIKMKVEFEKDIDDPIFAFIIKDMKGTEITGANNLFEKINSGRIKKGDIKEVCFKQIMNLQRGEYLLSLGCTGYINEEFKVYHRLYDICAINVLSKKNAIGYYDINSKIKII